MIPSFLPSSLQDDQTGLGWGGGGGFAADKTAPSTQMALASLRPSLREN